VRGLSRCRRRRGNSAGQAAVWLSRGGALVTLLHRRADLHETMSDYLVHDLDRYGVVVRDRSEIVALHGADGLLDAVTLTSGEQLPMSFLFLFLGASPCTDWLDHTVARDTDGFVLTGSAAASENMLETNIPVCLPPVTSVRLNQALCHGGRRGCDGRATRPRSDRSRLIAGATDQHRRATRGPEASRSRWSLGRCRTISRVAAGPPRAARTLPASTSGAPSPDTVT